MRAINVKRKVGGVITVHGGEFVDGFRVAVCVPDEHGDALLTPTEARNLADAIRWVAAQVERAKRAKPARRGKAGR